MFFRCRAFFVYNFFAVCYNFLLRHINFIIENEEELQKMCIRDSHIAEQLQGIKTPIILVINKTDTVKNQEDILTFINAYKDICDFAEIVPVSALRDKNTDTLLEQLFKMCIRDRIIPVHGRFFNTLFLYDFAGDVQDFTHPDCEIVCSSTFRIFRE